MCCAKCKTPYWCGNAGCACHEKSRAKNAERQHGLMVAGGMREIDEWTPFRRRK